jgi:hypothetical protein
MPGRLSFAAMKKVLWVLVTLATILVLSKCASVHIAHDHAARGLLATIGKVPLPEGALLIEEHSEVGGFISGKGDAIDVIAYRVFASDRSELEVYQSFVDYLQGDPGEGERGVFKLDTPKASGSTVPEDLLRRMISPQKRSTYVVYAAERVDDGTWDWRGW